MGTLQCLRRSEQSTDLVEVFDVTFYFVSWSVISVQVSDNGGWIPNQVTCFPN